MQMNTPALAHAQRGPFSGQLAQTWLCGSFSKSINVLRRCASTVMLFDMLRA